MKITSVITSVVCLLLILFSFDVRGQIPITGAELSQEAQRRRQEASQPTKLEPAPRATLYEAMRAREEEEASRQVMVATRSSTKIFFSPVILNKEQKTLLKPDEQDFVVYKTFLKQSKTGLVKIFSDIGCDRSNTQIISADRDCSKWIPNSAFYSFLSRKYSKAYLADISYKEGSFVSDGVLAQGIMTVLGDVSLENVSLSNNKIRFLVDYKPKAEAGEAISQINKAKAGFKVGEEIYRNTWQTRENTTYVLRAIDYRGNLPYSHNGYVTNILDPEMRKDIIVAFRVIHQNADGSVTILWKELARRNSPKLVLNEKTKTKTATD